MLPRYRPLRQEFPTGPYVADCRTFDVPNTIAAMVRGAPQNCVAITLRPLGGEFMIAAAEREARHRNIRLLWVPRRAALRGTVL